MIHHLQASADGGRTDDNQVSLCFQHHDGLDRHDHILAGAPTRAEGLVARNRYGLAIGPPRVVAERASARTLGGA